MVLYLYFVCSPGCSTDMYYVPTRSLLGIVSVGWHMQVIGADVGIAPALIISSLPIYFFIHLQPLVICSCPLPHRKNVAWQKEKEKRERMKKLRQEVARERSNELQDHRMAQQGLQHVPLPPGSAPGVRLYAPYGTQSEVGQPTAAPPATQPVVTRTPAQLAQYPALEFGASRIGSSSSSFVVTADDVEQNEDHTASPTSDAHQHEVLAPTTASSSSSTDVPEDLVGQEDSSAAAAEDHSRPPGEELEEPHFAFLDHENVVNGQDDDHHDMIDNGIFGAVVASRSATGRAGSSGSSVGTSAPPAEDDDEEAVLQVDHVVAPGSKNDYGGSSAAATTGFLQDARVAEDQHAEEPATSSPMEVDIDGQGDLVEDGMMSNDDNDDLEASSHLECNDNACYGGTKKRSSRTRSAIPKPGVQAAGSNPPGPRAGAAAAVATGEHVVPHNVIVGGDDAKAQKVLDSPETAAAVNLYKPSAHVVVPAGAAKLVEYWDPKTQMYKVLKPGEQQYFPPGQDPDVRVTPAAAASAFLQSAANTIRAGWDYLLNAPFRSETETGGAATDENDIDNDREQIDPVHV
ncbi:unnamed protein product [Amoebophrya sp. A120]|nr:unnamed protein product [Amoebophrya sp. A120]|eukprot:GSA120T00017693001.1